MIKPIETEFDGHRFRSRLEARWAVFFKEMDWDYSYELEGYRFEYKGEILNYLPDFYVEEINAFIEVKGPLINEIDTMKVLGLSKDAGKRVYVFGNIPNIDKRYDNFLEVDMAYHDVLVSHVFRYDGIDDALDKARKAQFEHGVKG
tara:strand:+ start:3347 stop:3784 length:438 start_codon:yes stop_codon:yes gene_type:complete